MGAKLLLADDSVTIQKVVELTLADEEYDIVMVSDGASAFRKAEEMSPDLILADIVMPELNGYELCERVRSTPALSKTPVLLLSSTFETYDETRGQSVGANDHIIKPFESEELTRKIKNLLTHKDSAAESAAVPQAAAAAADVGGTGEFSLETPNLLGTDAVEEEGFEFELTDEFMDQAEEMFEDTEETSEYEMGDTLPELEELAEEGSLEELDVAMTAEGVTDILDDADERDAASGLADRGTSFREPGTVGQTMGTGTFPDSLEPETGEIDQELMEEEDVSLYEIREEFAETETMMQSGPIEEEDVFKIESSPGDLIDEFMGTEEMAGSAMAADQEEELTEAEILDAVEEPSVEKEDRPYGEAAESPWETESLDEAGDAEKADEVESLSVEESAGLSWGAGAAAGAGLAAAAPLVQERTDASAAEPGPTATAAVDEDTVRRIVAEMIEVKANEIIERIAWEVIPDLAEVLIKQEIQRIQQEVESS